MTMRRVAVIAFAFAILVAATSAHADAIDGEWCSAKGQNLLIEGPKIRLPSGVTIEGHYRRHEFAYEPPKDDPDAGQIIYMNLLNEEMMNLRHVKDGVSGKPELWRRCNVTSSLSCHRRIYSGDPSCHMTDLSNLLHDGSPQHVRG